MTLVKRSAEETIDYLATLEHGWDSYGAEAPSPLAISEARRTLVFLRAMGAEVDSGLIRPDANGGVVFYLVKPTTAMFSLTCWNDGTLGIGLLRPKEGEAKPREWDHLYSPPSRQMGGAN